MIDPVAPRHTAVAKAGMVPVTLTNGPTALELTSAPKHKKNPDVGTKVVYKTNRIFIDQADARALSQGEEVPPPLSCERACSSRMSTPM